MAIPNLKTKVNQKLKKEIETESEKQNKRDSRTLNFFDLKEGEKMKVLFVPDVNGEFWTKFHKHGPNLHIVKPDGKRAGVPKAGTIACAYKHTGEDCPACIKGFDLFELSKETGDKAIKEEGKKWMAKDYTLVSCIVLESPMEVTETEGGNQVKLMYLPYAVENIIKEALVEEQIGEDELCSIPFFIKKTKNSGGFPSYENSYFARSPIDEDELAYLEDMVVEQYDYTDLDVIPPNSTTNEVDEWLEKAEVEYDKAKEKNLRGRSSGDDGDREDKSPRTRSSALDRVKEKRQPEKEEAEPDADDSPEPEPQEPESDDGDQGEPEGDQESRLSSAQERLKNLKRRKTA